MGGLAAPWGLAVILLFYYHCYYYYYCPFLYCPIKVSLSQIMSFYLLFVCLVGLVSNSLPHPTAVQGVSEWLCGTCLA